MRKHILTPTEAECFEMLESLTGEPVAVDYEVADKLVFYVGYEHNKEPMFISAVMEAVRGRLGERLEELKDIPEAEAFKVIAKFDEMNLPEVVGSYEGPLEPDERAGHIYCRRLGEIRAVQVEEENIIDLQRFCGGGEMQIDRRGDGSKVVRFSFLNNGVFCDVPEHFYICRQDGDSAFLICSPSRFTEEWERK